MLSKLSNTTLLGPILQKQKAMDDLASLLVKWASEEVLKEAEKKQKQHAPKSG